MKRRRLPLVVALTAVPGLLFPCLFARALAHFAAVDLGLPWDVARLAELRRRPLVGFFLEEDLRQLGRLLAHNRDADAVLPGWRGANDQLHIDLPRASREALEAELPRSAEAYQPASLWNRGRYQRVKLRYRGNSGRHWLFPKRSLKLKSSKRRLIRGHRVLNLSVKAPYTELLALDLARRFGLLTPDAELVQVFVNQRFYGIEAFLEEIDEGFLLRHRRMPGTIYKGEAYPATNEWHHGTRLGWLFHSPTVWPLSARDNAVPEDYRADLAALCRAHSAPEPATLDALLARVEPEAIARHIAYKLLLAEWHQRDTNNQKLYRDPTTGRFEPIVWDPYLRDNAPLFALAPVQRGVPLERSPSVLPGLYHSLGAEPTLVHRALHLLWERLEDPSLFAGADALAAHAEDHAAALRLDPQSPFYSQAAAQVAEARAVLAGNRDRLRQALGAAELQVHAQGSAAILGARGLGGVRLESLLVAWDGDPGELSLIQDLDRDLRPEATDPRPAVVASPAGPGRVRLSLRRPLLILPAYLGLDRLQPLPVPHPFLLPPGARVLEGAARHALTGAPVTTRVVEAWPARELDSRHPWTRHPGLPSGPVRPAGIWPADLWPPLPARERRLQGRVQLRDDLRIAPDEVLRIEPGTELLLGPGVSILAEGRVFAEGDPAAPIALRPADPRRPWGVLALQGPGASGSRFAHARFAGGSLARHGEVSYPGMVSVHGARDVRFRSCTFRDNQRGDDALRGAHAELHVRDCAFEGVHRDALDLDISTGSIRGCRFAAVGNDAIDLMRSDPLIQDTRIAGCEDKGISIGERSEPVVFAVEIRNCAVGVQIKDRSDPLLLQVEVSGCGIGVDARRKNWRYGGGGRGRLINAQVQANARDVVVDADSRLTLSSVRADVLDPLALQDGRLRVQPLPGAALSPDPRPYARFAPRGEPARVGLPRVHQPLVPRPLLWEQRFRDGFALDAPAWTAEGARLRVQADLLVAEGNGPLLRLELGRDHLPAGARLHLQAGASPAGPGSLTIDGREQPLRLVEEPTWVALDPGPGAGTLELRAPDARELRVRRLALTGPAP